MHYSKLTGKAAVMLAAAMLTTSPYTGYAAQIAADSEAESEYQTEDEAYASEEEKGTTDTAVYAEQESEAVTEIVTEAESEVQPETVTETETTSAASEAAETQPAVETTEENAADDVYTSGAGAAAGDEGAEIRYSNDAISLADASDAETISQASFINTLLSKVGKGYSQAYRYDANYYDCSSLILRCMQEYGLTGVPYTTSGWNSLLAGKNIGDTVTFTGNGKKLTYRLTAVNTNVIDNPAAFEVPGTIMVLIEASESSGHVAVSLGSFDRQNGNYSSSQTNAILELTKSYVADRLVERYGANKSLLLGTNSISGFANMWLAERYIGTDLQITGGVYSGVYNRIWRVEAYNPSTGVCVTNAPNGTHGNNCKYVLVPVTASGANESVVKENLSIDSVDVSDVTSDGYKVTVNFTSSYGVSQVLMPTWTEKDGQDDIIWHKATVDGNTATFYVPVSAHNNENGNYVTHVYVYSKSGAHVIEGTSASVPAKESAPKISSVTSSDVTSDGYKVTVKFTAEAGVKEVLMPTWTENKGQDDIVWHKAAVNGDTAEFYVPVSAHKSEAGKYLTHVYVYDNNGQFALQGISVTVPEKVKVLKIDSASVSNVTSDGYNVTVKFTAEAGIKEVMLPTWTEKNGQDDIVWHVANVRGNTATFYVPVSAHNNESGTYITHVYVRDKAGKEVLTGVSANVPAASTDPSISNITVSEVSSSGYRVTATFSAPAGVKQVFMPTWTENKGQDDIVWHVANVRGNTATFYVSKSAHKNESGTYTTHVYVYDNNGKFALEGTSATVK